MKRAVIVDAVRTPSGKGRPGGALSEVHPVELLSQTLRGLLDRTDVDPESIDDVIAGCVSQSGEQTLNVARNALLTAGLPERVPGTSVDRQCGSSQQAAHFAAQGVMAGAYDIVLACGVESMSRVPMGASSLNQNPQSPLCARYPEGFVTQGVAAELIAARWQLDRETLDDFAVRSHRLASEHASSGAFDNEIVPVALSDGSIVREDETIRATTNAELLADLKPAFESPELATRFPEIDWRITAGNSSPLTDGASAMLIMSEETAEKLCLEPLAAFHSFGIVGSDPLLMLTGPIAATHKVLDRAGLRIDDIDVYEVNEAFAPVPLAWLHDVGGDPGRVNPRGGAIALGHALGASGARLMTTMAYHLRDTGGRYGLQTMCEGGGMANATILERL